MLVRYFNWAPIHEFLPFFRSYDFPTRVAARGAGLFLALAVGFCLAKTATSHAALLS